MTDKCDQGCLCQGCGVRYQVDFFVPDALWAKIKPTNKPDGAGLLCGECIVSRIEKMGFATFRVEACQ